MTRPRLTRRGQAFLGGGLALAASALLLGFPDLTRIGVLLLALPLLATLSSWRRRPRLELTRSVTPPALRPGELGRVRTEIRCPGPRPSLTQLAEERLDPTLGGVARFVLPSLAPGRRHAVGYAVRGTVRGLHRVGPLELRQEDPFGLTVRSVVLGGATEVVVLPEVVELTDAVVPPSGVAGTGPVPHMVAVYGEDDVSTRRYQQGDDLRRVHWPATAHRGELMVRQEERPARRRATLVLDPRRSAYHGAGARDTFEWAVSALASVAVLLAGDGYRLHLVTAETVREGIAGRPLGRDAVLRHLALAERADGGLPEVLHASWAVAAGLVVAVAGARDGAALDRLAATRPPGTTGVLLLLAAPAEPRGTPAAELVHRGQAAGWRVHLVRPGESVAAAWRAATGEVPVEVPR